MQQQIRIMKKILRSNIVDLLYLSSLSIWVAVYSYPMFFKSLSGNHREIQTYNLDSMIMLTSVENALSSNYFYFSFFDYGHLYFNISIAIAFIYSLFLPLDERTLFFILRLVALLGGCFSIALVFVFARRFLGRIEAFFSAGVVAFTPALLEWSNEVKPDSWQMFFVTLCLYFCARAVAPVQSTDKGSESLQDWQRTRFVMAAAAAAGAAFSTKFLGIILFPLLAAAALIAPAGGMSDPLFAPKARFAGAATFIRRFNFAPYRSPLIKIGRLIGVVLVFFAVFVVTSPWSVYHLQFLRVLRARSGIVNTGDWFGFQWLPYLLGYAGHDSSFVGRGTAVLTVLGATLLIIALCRRNFRGAYLPFMFVLGFVVIFTALLITRVNRVTVLYALPVVPPFALLAAFGLSEVRHLIMRWYGESCAGAAAAALAALLIAAQIWHGATTVLKYPHLVVALEPHNQMLSDWLLRCAPPDTRILAASYTYVPPRFEHATMADGYDNFNSFKPELVIINLKLVAEVAKASEKSSVDLDYETSDRKRFHDIVLRSGEWRPGPGFAHIQVFVTPQLGSVMNTGCL